MDGDSIYIALFIRISKRLASWLAVIYFAGGLTMAVALFGAYGAYREKKIYLIVVSVSSSNSYLNTEIVEKT